MRLWAIVVVAAILGSTGVVAAAPAVATGVVAVAPAAADPPATTVLTAGSAQNYTGSFREPQDITNGPDGNLWFTTGHSSSIWRTTPGGVVSSFTAPSVQQPMSIAAGPDGNLWFTDEVTEALGRITPAGVITPFAGLGIDRPVSVTGGPDGNVWFVNQGDSSIGRITPQGVVTRFPWTLAPTYPGVTVRLGQIVVGADGNLWFSTGTMQIGRITPAGVMSAFAVAANPGSLTLGPDGNVWFAESSPYTKAPGHIGKVTPSGASTVFAFEDFLAWGITAADGYLWVSGPQLKKFTVQGVLAETLPFYSGTLITGADHNLWLTEFGGITITSITTAGAVVAVIKGTEPINTPMAVAAGSDGNIWYINNPEGDADPASIGRVTPGGVVSRFASPSIVDPTDMVRGPDGNLWITDRNSVVRLQPDGTFLNFPVPGAAPTAITAGADGALWFGVTTSPPSLRRLTVDGTFTVVPIAVAASVGNITRLTAGSDGNLWIATSTAQLMSVTTGGAVNWLSEPLAVRIRRIASGPDGNLWFGATFQAVENRIGRVAPSGGAPTYVSTMNPPGGLAAGPDGAMWFTDGFEVGRITVSGELSYVRSTGGSNDDVEAEGRSIALGADGRMWFGSSPFSIGAAVAVGAPAPPRDVNVVPGRRQATVSWSAAYFDGGSPVTGYTVTASPGGATCTSTTGPGSCTVTGLTAGTSYRFTVRAANAHGEGAPSIPWQSVSTTRGPGFHSLVPSRILDSRTANGGWNGPLAAAMPRTLKVTGAPGASSVPEAATAVVMNVTVTGATNGSFVSVWPGGEARPTSSAVNFAPGETIANLVTVKIGTGGTVAFANAVGATHVIADIVGYYDAATGAAAGDRFDALTPRRILDSRTPNGGWAGSLPAGSPRPLAVRQPAVPNGVPATATAVVANVTATNATAGSFLTVWPTGTPRPTASTVNFAAGQTIPNLAVVKIGADGTISIANAVGAVDVIVDIVAYFDPTASSSFYPISPTRILDDRVGTGLTGPWLPHTTRSLPVGGAPGTGIPGDATGLVANFTATNATTGSFVTVFPDGVAQPTSSNLNFGAQQTIANLTVVGLPANGSIAISNQLGSVDLVADAVGYFRPD